jgi:hypothetical protein
MKTETQSGSSLRARVAQAVEAGRNIREEVSQSVVEAVQAGIEGARGLEELMTAVARGAVDGARSSVRGGRHPDLVEVVDGVGDGLEKAALALRLTAEEAARASAQQARDDAARAARSLERAGRRFVIALGRGLGHAGDDIAARTGEARNHLIRLRERLAPVFDEVFDNLGQRPGAVAGAVVDAVQGAVRGGSREARSAVGAALSELGRKLGGPPTQP